MNDGGRVRPPTFAPVLALGATSAATSSASGPAGHGLAVPPWAIWASCTVLVAGAIHALWRLARKREAR
jgi:hypothetical protein